MAVTEIKVGSEIEAKCGKCKKDTLHVVIAMVKDKPKRVECLACHALHNYRKPGVAAKKTTKSKRKTALALSEENAVDYDPKAKYQLDSVLRHKKFGLGLITRVDLTRITVQFEDKMIRKLILTPVMEEE